MFPFGVTRTFEEKAKKSTRRVWWRDEDDWEARMLDEERGVADLVTFDMSASVEDFATSLQEQQVFVLIGGSDKSTGPSSKFLAAMREDDRKLKELLQKDKDKKNKKSTGGNDSDDSAFDSLLDSEDSGDDYSKSKRQDAAKQRKAKKKNSDPGYFNLSDSEEEERQMRRRNSALTGAAQISSPRTITAKALPKLPPRRAKS